MFISIPQLKAPILDVNFNIPQSKTNCVSCKITIERKCSKFSEKEPLEYYVLCVYQKAISSATTKLPCSPGSLTQAVVQVCLKELNHPELMSNYLVHTVPSQTVVRAGLKGLIHPKLMSNYLAHTVPSAKLWFEQVQSKLITTTSN